jgi:hypothetical protein
LLFSKATLLACFINLDVRGSLLECLAHCRRLLLLEQVLPLVLVLLQVLPLVLPLVPLPEQEQE